MAAQPGLTRDRILAAALASFGTRGYEATSLDDLARELGVRKQTILYWFTSKEALLAAVIDAAAEELAAELERTLVSAGEGWDRVAGLIRKVFRLAARRPALLGLLREANRLGPPLSSPLAARLAPLADRAVAFLEAEMDAGRLRRHEPTVVLLTAYALLTGLAIELETQRALGMATDLRSLVRRERGVEALLRAALVP